MRGNLVSNTQDRIFTGKVEFEKDEQNGHWEIVDGKIIPYHKSAVDEIVERKNSILTEAEHTSIFGQAKQEGDEFWNDELVGEFGEWYRERQGKSVECWGEDMIQIFKKGKQAKQESNTPDYVITAFENRNNGIWKLGDDNKFRLEGWQDGYASEELVRMAPFEIHSVKRLSDNSEFTVDEVTEQGKIVEFGFGGTHQVHCSNGYYKLSELSKKKDNAVMVDMDAPLLSVRDVMSISDYIVKPDEDSKFFSYQGLIELTKQKSKQ